MKTVYTRRELGEALGCGENIGFVPTMGALHAGHISLVERARADGGMVVVSVFVNPTQFNDPDDLRRYPRTPEADLKMLEAAGADVVFMPTVEEVYPEPDTRDFDFGQLDKVMEGATRPGHFNGVAQVVSRLFDLVQPARAYFGEKDFQQIAVIREMVRQLDMPVRIVALPIVREADGLAMSSRNALLTAGARTAAPLIYKVLREGVALAATHSPAEVEAEVMRRINSNPELKVIYFELVDSATLQPVGSWTGSVRGCVAVQAGNVRLIDNVSYDH
jgi:pantoate--beta-alanine ligase